MILIVNNNIFVLHKIQEPFISNNINKFSWGMEKTIFPLKKAPSSFHK